MRFKTSCPKCVKCGKFLKNGECVVEKNLDTFAQEPEFFEDMIPYCYDCWNRVHPDKLVISSKEILK